MALKSILCYVQGHDWEKRPVKSILTPDEVIGICRRCQKKYHTHEAMGLGKGSPPRELIDQDDVDKLTAMYRDGEIDQERFEAGVEAALGDNSELEALVEGDESP